MGKRPEAAAGGDGTAAGHARFYWCWLIFATSVSVLGNITHALLVAPDALRLLAAIASVVPPAFVLGSTHSAAVSLRTRRFALNYILGLLMTIVVAACAFLLSFDALRALAVILGWPPGRAWLFPMAIDVSIAQATFGLLAPTPAATTASLEAPGVDDRTTGIGPQPISGQAGRKVTRNGQTHDGAGATELLTPIPAQPISMPKPTETSATAIPANREDTIDTARWRYLAHQLIRNGTTSKDPEVVAAILAEHAAGTPPGTISRRRGVHHSTVGRILAAAAHLTG